MKQTYFRQLVIAFSWVTGIVNCMREKKTISRTHQCIESREKTSPPLIPSLQFTAVTFNKHPLRIIIFEAQRAYRDTKFDKLLCFVETCACSYLFWGFSIKPLPKKKKRNRKINKNSIANSEISYFAHHELKIRDYHNLAKPIVRYTCLQPEINNMRRRL